MPPARQQGLLTCIANLIDTSYHGQVTKRYMTQLAAATPHKLSELSRAISRPSATALKTVRQQATGQENPHSPLDAQPGSSRLRRVCPGGSRRPAGRLDQRFVVWAARDLVAPRDPGAYVAAADLS
jgi:hypothetical protein